MKVFSAFINTVTPELNKREFQLCLILLDMYYWDSHGVLSMPEIKEHPLMTKSLMNNIRKVIDILNGRKIMKRYQWPHTAPAPDFKIERLEAEFVLFDELSVIDKVLKIRVNEQVLNYFNKYELLNINPDVINGINKYNMIKLYLWYKTWELNGFIKCNIDWLKMYLDINVETRSLNDKYIKEFLRVMKYIGVNLRVGNVYDKKWTSSIVYLLVSIVTKDTQETPVVLSRRSGRRL